MDLSAKIIEAKREIEKATANLVLSSNVTALPPAGAAHAALAKAFEHLYCLEREWAASKGLPHALTWDDSGQWDRQAWGADVWPVVISGLFVTSLAFGTAEYGKVLVFSHPLATKFSCINDEVISGHPLAGRGLESCGAHVVVHSPWIDELEKINSVHLQHDAEIYKKAQHVVLCFKDRMFEAVYVQEPRWFAFPDLTQASAAALDLTLRHESGMSAGEVMQRRIDDRLLSR